MTHTESALIIPVPDAEPLVHSYRQRHDPSAAVGVPAHITVLYPFLPPVRLTPGVLVQLAQLFTASAPFDYALARLRRFPDVLYLAPEPDHAFRDLTRQVHDLYPECAPYGGVFSDVIPHLTLAQLPEAASLEQIAADFEATSGSQLPLQTRATHITLMENAAGRWRVGQTFRLGSPAIAVR